MAFQIRGAGRAVTEGVKFVKCGACGRSADPMPVGGKGERGILVVFEQPTTTQWSARSWFAGGDATVLQTLNSLGLALMQDVSVTAVLPCIATKSEPVFRYEQCVLKLQETIKAVRPKLIITVGSGATGAVLRLYHPRHYAQNHTSGQFFGRCIPLTDSEEWNCWLAPVQPDREIHANQNIQMQQVAKDSVYRALEWAIDIGRNRPGLQLPPMVELHFESDRICGALEDAMTAPCVAFDYETNALQPETIGAKILTAAITFEKDSGYRTVAFPMASESVKRQWCRFLQSDVAKIGANIKFEHRWSTVSLGTPVVNWHWDVCVGGRILDCVPGNSGLKFLTFVHFGVIGYDDSVSPFMKDGANGHNDLDKANVTDLLTYNGYDAYYTMRCFKKQQEILPISD